MTGKDKDDVTLDCLVINGRSITSTDALLAQIEASGQPFKDFRGRHAKCWGTLKLFVSPLTAVMNIAITPSSLGEFRILVSAVLGACLLLVGVSKHSRCSACCRPRKEKSILIWEKEKEGVAV